MSTFEFHERKIEFAKQSIKKWKELILEYEGKTQEHEKAIEELEAKERERTEPKLDFSNRSGFYYRIRQGRIEYCSLPEPSTAWLREYFATILKNGNLLLNNGHELVEVEQ